MGASSAGKFVEVNKTPFLSRRGRSISFKVPTNRAPLNTTGAWTFKLPTIRKQRLKYGNLVIYIVYIYTIGNCCF